MIGMYAFAYPNMIVEHYTAERGLPNNIVNCTLKGQDGFIWFGTWYGLCSFDGSKFRSYDNHDGFYSTDIPPRKIQRIVEDKNGFLWIKTIDRKLYLFDKRHESFHAVYDDVKEYSENIQNMLCFRRMSYTFTLGRESCNCFIVILPSLSVYARKRLLSFVSNNTSPSSVV